MFIFLLLACTIAALIILLRFKVPLGPAILLCGLGLWLVQKPEVSLLINSAKTMLLKTRTWDLVGALYFVVCLEIELRKSGCLAGMVKYLQQLTPNKKVGIRRLIQESSAFRPGSTSRASSEARGQSPRHLMGGNV